jgi:hypothetical protein
VNKSYLIEAVKTKKSELNVETSETSIPFSHDYDLMC